ncbi:HAD family hydrolase [Algiphilus sp.]|uniref:histidinol-phosphatase n=1 Tax=Algiphilus sp. TaxID=1872431 RepID=UPI0025BFD432|nr:HAD family hydrolase [Algiphilus sp.]MCK5769794.1 HAD family hydrolase [Algiphilus sp.]
MALAVFDLDHTLLRGDSDYLWGEYLVEQGLVDGPAYKARNQAFYEAYMAGTLDIAAFCAFSFEPLVQWGHAHLAPLRARFVDERIAPLVAPGAQALLDGHRGRGDRLVITTATNRFVTEPIAALFGIEDLIATDPEVRDGRFTGRIAGTPNFREGKPERLRKWIRDQGMEGEPMTCYSDSRNDIPLLEMADTAVAVDPDDALAAVARERGWALLSLS